MKHSLDYSNNIFNFRNITERFRSLSTPVNIAESNISDDDLSMMQGLLSSIELRNKLNNMAGKNEIEALLNLSDTNFYLELEVTKIKCSDIIQSVTFTKDNFSATYAIRNKDDYEILRKRFPES